MEADLTLIYHYVVGYRLNRLDEPVFIALSKPLLTEFGIHYRLESCDSLNVFFMTSFRPPTCISVLKRLRPATSRLSSWATKLKWASQKPSKITKPCWRLGYTSTLATAGNKSFQVKLSPVFFVWAHLCLWKDVIVVYIWQIILKSCVKVTSKTSLKCSA